MKRKTAKNSSRCPHYLIVPVILCWTLFVFLYWYPLLYNGIECVVGNEEGAEDSEEEEDFIDDLYCVACNKSFKTEKA